jgi:ubiquitin thioesterase protein OTUB1
LSEYEKADSPFFIPGIDYISKSYIHMRRVRGDGNCFYRAFIFSYLEGLLRDYNLDAEKKMFAEKERDRITKIIDDSKLELVTKHSYSEIAIESFQEVDELPSKMNFCFDDSPPYM